MEGLLNRFVPRDGCWTGEAVGQTLQPDGGGPNNVKVDGDGGSLLLGDLVKKSV